MTATNALLHEDLLPAMPPHLLSLGFDWSNSGYGDLDIDATNETTYPEKGTQKTQQTRSHQQDTIHTSLCFQKPVGHPLHPQSRRRQRQHLPSFLQKCNLERVASNKTWASDESVCVSSLGAGGWDDIDDDDEDDDDAEYDLGLEAENEQDDLSGITLPADIWTVLVDEPACESEAISWFKVVRKGQPDVVLWLEDEEIFILLHILATSSTTSLCIHLVKDDVSAIVSLAHANDYLSTMLSVPALAHGTSGSSSTATTYSILSRRLACLEKSRLRVDIAQT